MYLHYDELIKINAAIYLTVSLTGFAFEYLKLDQEEGSANFLFKGSFITNNLTVKQWNSALVSSIYHFNYQVHNEKTRAIYITYSGIRDTCKLVYPAASESLI